MKFSVVTAVRNAANTIADSINSINVQTWKNVEHIVVDACSTDGTLDVIRSRSERAMSLISEPDSGVYDGFNKGLYRCSGDVISFLNADDFYIDKNVMADVARIFRDPKVDCVFGDVVYVDKNDVNRVVRRYDSGIFRPSRIRLGVMPAHPATFVRSGLFDRLGAFNPSYEIGGDFEFIARALGRGRASYHYIHRALTVMRTGGISTRGISANWTITREIVRACRANGIETNYAWAIMRLLMKVPNVSFRPSERVLNSSDQGKS